MTFQCFLQFYRLPPYFVHLTIVMGCPLFPISAHLCLLCLLPSTYQTKFVFLPSLASYTSDLGPFSVQKEELTQALPTFSIQLLPSMGFLEQNTIHTKAPNCPGRAWAIWWNPWCSLPNVASIQHSQVLTHLWNGWMLARRSHGQPETQVGISNGSSASLVFETIEAIIDCSPEPQHQAVSPWYALDLTSPDFPLQFMI